MDLFLKIRFLTILLVFFTIGFVFSQEPGSIDDPVVTKSYVENIYSWQETALSAGQTISLERGVELIVRQGTVKVVASVDGGLIDLTTGKELGNDEIIPLYHLIICPDSDGRAVKCDVNSLLLTRGLGK